MRGDKRTLDATTPLCLHYVAELVDWAEQEGKTYADLVAEMDQDYDDGLACWEAEDVDDCIDRREARRDDE